MVLSAGEVAAYDVRSVSTGILLHPTGVPLQACDCDGTHRVAQILAIPGCHPNPYAFGRCSIGSVNLAAPLQIGLLGGLYVAGALGVCVSVPLFLGARWRTWANKRRTKGVEARS